MQFTCFIWPMRKAIVIVFWTIQIMFISVASAQKRPNILCLVAEDISPYLGCYGDPVARTPFLDTLAAESILFRHLYTTVGVCAPSRAALITGMYPTAIGANYMRNTTMNSAERPVGIEPYEVVLPEGVRCYTEYLREAGYYCTNNSKTDYQFTPPLTAWDENGKSAHWRNRPADMPFFSIFNFEVTHESAIWNRNTLPLAVDPAKVPLPPYYPNDSLVRHDVAVMYSNIHELDRQVKKMVNELEQDGLLANTIILFYADNGGPLPRQKREVYESGTLVPLMVRFPDGYNKGTSNMQLCSFVDIPPTILSLAGIRPPDYMHGRAFLGKYRQAPRQFVYGARDRMDEQVDKQGYVRSKKFRYVKNYFPEKPGYMPVTYRLQMPMMKRLLELREKNRLNAVQQLWFNAPRPTEELYDVESDPHEIRNLSLNPAYKKQLAQLRNEYARWDAQYHTVWHQPETENRKQMWPDGTQPVVQSPQIRQTKSGFVLQSATGGASIGYQVNGRGYKKDHWMLYTTPLRVHKGDVITAVAVRAGYRNSETVSLTVP